MLSCAAGCLVLNNFQESKRKGGRQGDCNPGKSPKQAVVTQAKGRERCVQGYQVVDLTSKKLFNNVTRGDSVVQLAADSWDKSTSP